MLYKFLKTVYNKGEKRRRRKISAVSRLIRICSRGIVIPVLFLSVTQCLLSLTQFVDSNRARQKLPRNKKKTLANLSYPHSSDSIPFLSQLLTQTRVDSTLPSILKTQIRIKIKRQETLTQAASAS